MVFPELALSAGSLGSLGRFLRVRMDAIQRKVAIYDLNLFRILDSVSEAFEYLKEELTQLYL